MQGKQLQQHGADCELLNQFATNVIKTVYPNYCPSCFHCSVQLFHLSFEEANVPPFIFTTNKNPKFCMGVLYRSQHKGRQEIIFLTEKELFFTFSFLSLPLNRLLLPIFRVPVALLAFIVCILYSICTVQKYCKPIS